MYFNWKTMPGMILEKPLSNSKGFISHGHWVNLIGERIQQGIKILVETAKPGLRNFSIIKFSLQVIECCVLRVRLYIEFIELKLHVATRQILTLFRMAPPPSFFPCNFYKRTNYPQNFLTFSFNPFCHTGVNFQVCA